jgi:hypothetical protein
LERTDWLDAGFDPRQARFLMVTAITHHCFSSPTWSEAEVLKLCAELREIEDDLLREVEPVQPGHAAYRGYLPLGVGST